MKENNMTTWQVSTTFRTNNRFEEDIAFELIDALSEYSAAMGLDQDLRGGSVTLFVDADQAPDAATQGATLVTTAATPLLGGVAVVGLEVLTEEAVDAELARPLFPEVVGYAEIAEMAGVSRQRARQFADMPTFPSPVISTGQGPLMSKSAVRVWIEKRNTKNGRPRVSVASGI